MLGDLREGVLAGSLRPFSWAALWRAVEVKCGMRFELYWLAFWPVRGATFALGAVGTAADQARLERYSCPYSPEAMCGVAAHSENTQKTAVQSSLTPLSPHAVAKNETFIGSSKRRSLKTVPSVSRNSRMIVDRNTRDKHCSPEEAVIQHRAATCRIGQI